jgi:hypothetical protein
MRIPDDQESLGTALAAATRCGGGIRARLQSLYLAPAATSLPVCADLLGVCNHGVSSARVFRRAGPHGLPNSALQSLLQGGVRSCPLQRTRGAA